ncbi:MAG: BON domain-containing protein [Cytophagaceae bacterium]|jgi:hypothetical protein|nr:BON domain-containing protein [Cytophagaceae bacterium]
MKKTFLGAMIAIVFLIGFTACGPKDAEIKTGVETALQGLDLSGVSVAVEKGAVSISGTCKEEAVKAKVEELAKAVKGVKSVTNAITVEKPVEVVQEVVQETVAQVSELEQKVKDALKDFPGVTYELMGEEIKLKGEIAKSKLMVLMQGLQALNLKVNSKELVKK